MEAQELISAVRKRVADNPEFIYEMLTVKEGFRSCLYVHEGKPSCLLGRAMYDCGVSLIDLECFDKDEILLGDILEEVVQYETGNQLNWLCKVQLMQDMGNPWEDCIAEADEYYPLA